MRASSGPLLLLLGSAATGAAATSDTGIVPNYQELVRSLQAHYTSGKWDAILGLYHSGACSTFPDPAQTSKPIAGKPGLITVCGKENMRPYFDGMKQMYGSTDATMIYSTHEPAAQAEFAEKRAEGGSDFDGLANNERFFFADWCMTSTEEARKAMNAETWAKEPAAVKAWQKERCLHSGWVLRKDHGKGGEGKWKVYREVQFPFWFMESQEDGESSKQALSPIGESIMALQELSNSPTFQQDSSAVDKVYSRKVTEVIPALHGGVETLAPGDGSFDTMNHDLRVAAKGRRGLIKLMDASWGQASAETYATMDTVGLMAYAAGPTATEVVSKEKDAGAKAEAAADGNYAADLVQTAIDLEEYETPAAASVTHFCWVDPGTGKHTRDSKGKITGAAKPAKRCMHAMDIYEQGDDGALGGIRWEMMVLPTEGNPGLWKPGQADPKESKKSVAAPAPAAMELAAEVPETAAASSALWSSFSSLCLVSLGLLASVGAFFLGRAKDVEPVRDASSERLLWYQRMA